MQYFPSQAEGAASAGIFSALSFFVAETPTNILKYFLKTHSQGLAVLYKVCQYAIRIYLLYFANYILHMSSKIVCVYEIFFSVPTRNGSYDKD